MYSCQGFLHLFTPSTHIFVFFKKKNNVLISALNFQNNKRNRIWDLNNRTHQDISPREKRMDNEKAINQQLKKANFTSMRHVFAWFPVSTMGWVCRRHNSEHSLHCGLEHILPNSSDVYRASLGLLSRVKYKNKLFELMQAVVNTVAGWNVTESLAITGKSPKSE